MHRFRRLSLVLALIMVLSMVLAALPMGASAAALDWDITNGHYFTQTNGQPEGTSQAGYSVTNNDGVPFWDEFKRDGGLRIVGYPMSQRFMWDGFVTQVFQKAIFQWKPVDQRVDFINAFDQMSLAGKDDWLLNFKSTPKPLDAATFDAGKTWDQIVAARLALLNANPAIKAVYNSVPDPIRLFGLPTSQVVDNGNHYAIRLQRAVIQQWKVAVPWAAAGQVTIGNGGDISVQAGIISGTALQPEAGPPGTNNPPPPVVNPPVTTSGFGYGMQAHLWGVPAAQPLDMVKGAGFNWVKQQLRWEWVEKNGKGQFEWNTPDAIVDQAAARGLKVLFSITASPQWANGGNRVTAPPLNPNDLADFLSAMATRYKGRVGAYEIWNEQNLSCAEWGCKPVNAADYVNLLRVAYQAVKAADPSAIVVSGALTPTGWNDGATAVDDVVFMDQMYAAGMKNYCDVVGAHPNGFDNPPGDWMDKATDDDATMKGHPSFYFRRAEQLHDIMVKYGDGNKKLWFTEVGWSTANANPDYAYGAHNTEAEQAKFLVDAFTMSKNWGWVGAMFVWNLNFQTVVGANDEKYPYGIVRSDWSPRPSYTALQNLPK
ncbi:MAG: cellulase family glycosylhydrolase [Chloroflexi bacterium]|nr:cellulase family glycosylhydrolase [Chloroflexota bacterium]MCL5109514.1 cellulase family glycosylhydrolase [Chloroflexota bacterium]